MTAFQSHELSHKVAVIAMRPWLCDCTQILSSSCLLLVLCTLVYMHLREVKGAEYAGFPREVSNFYTPLRWLTS